MILIKCFMKDIDRVVKEMENKGYFEAFRDGNSGQPNVAFWKPKPSFLFLS